MTKNHSPSRELSRTNEENAQRSRTEPSQDLLATAPVVIAAILLSGRNHDLKVDAGITKI